MGCNAWNHSLSCNCGWGGNGNGYAGERTSHAIEGLHFNIRDYASDGSWREAWSQNPNAICPVCGEAVFFIQPRHGGRVFFDELGPPWPKHPCTDNPARPVYAPRPGTLTRPYHNSDWDLLAETEFEKKTVGWLVKGKHQEAKRSIRLQLPDGDFGAPSLPFMVKRDNVTGLYQCAFLSEQARPGALLDVTLTAYPALTSVKTWKKALAGDADAMVILGKAHSFDLDDKPNGLQQRQPDIAKHWFAKAAMQGHSEGLYYLANLLLQTQHRKEADRLRGYEKAWGLLLEAALLQEPRAIERIGRMLKPGQHPADTSQLGILLESHDRHLRFHQPTGMPPYQGARLLADKSGNSLPTLLDTLREAAANAQTNSTTTAPEHTKLVNSGVCYSPLPITAYRHFETARNLASQDDYLPQWNLLWLSVEGLDTPLQPGKLTAWYAQLHIPHHMLPTLAFDMDKPLVPGMTLRSALRKSPSDFIEIFSRAYTSKLFIQKMNPEWRDRILKRTYLAINKQ